MSLFSRLFSGLFGARTSQPKRSQNVRGSYDSAGNGNENFEHWANSDSYSANAANSPAVRQTLRDRSRYEHDNNGYYSGLTESISNDVVGTSPRVQISIPGDDGRIISRKIERLFMKWVQASDFPQDLRTMVRTAIVAGESFAIITSNPQLSKDGRNLVELDLQIYEPEQVSDPWDYGTDPLYSDGIRFDELGNPVEYTFLKNHPGGVALIRSWETEVFPADSVIHWLKPTRPGQHRGVPWLTAALPLFAQMRRYTLATLSSAEFAAMLAGVMKTNILPDSGAILPPEQWDTFSLVRGSLLTLPAGWEAQQFEAKQPISTYRDFKGEILNEIGRGAQAPFNVIAGNSSGYNYSSGRLDHQIYQKSIGIERFRIEQKILSRVFWLWLREAELVYGIRKQADQIGLPPTHEWGWSWFWDGFTSIDPQKDAAADKIRLENGVTTIAEICAAEGKDWEEVIRQRARERQLEQELALELGIKPPQKTKAKSDDLDLIDVGGEPWHE